MRTTSRPPRALTAEEAKSARERAGWANIQHVLRAPRAEPDAAGLAHRVLEAVRFGSWHTSAQQDAQSAYQHEILSYRSSPTGRPHDENEALGLLHEGLQAAELKLADLAALAGNDARKVAIRQRTTVSNGWLAERLSMRSAANVSQILRRAAAK